MVFLVFSRNRFDRPPTSQLLVKCRFKTILRQISVHEGRGFRRSQMRIPFHFLLAPLSQLDVIFDLIRRSWSHTSGGHFSFHPLYYTKYNIHKLYIYLNIFFLLYYMKFASVGTTCVGRGSY